MFNRIVVYLCMLGAVTLSAASLTACSTVEGAGKDISHLGGAIQHEARENK